MVHIYKFNFMNYLIKNLLEFVPLWAESGRQKGIKIIRIDVELRMGT